MQADESKLQWDGRGQAFRQASALCANRCSEDVQQQAWASGQKACAVSLELRSLIQDIDEKLCDRFDRIDARLDELGSQIASQLVSGNVEAAPFEPLEVMSSDSDEGKCECDSQKETPEADVAEADPNKTQRREGRTISIRTVRSDSAVAAVQYVLRSDWQMNNTLFKKSAFTPVEWKSLDDFMDSSEIYEMDEGAKPWWLFPPSSHFRLVWDSLTMAIIGHDMAVIPVHLAFGIEENQVSRFLFWPTLCFWTIDIPLSFVTGFYRHGVVETRLSQIVRQYMCTWFFLDLFMVSSSWIEGLLGLQADPMTLGRVGKTLRILRIIRSLRMLRLMKLRRIMEDIQDRITSEFAHIIMAVFRLCVFVLWANHFIACMWWAIGSSGSRQGEDDTDSSWTSHFEFQSSDLAYQYFTALHWSLTQFTPASMEITPRNALERVFAVVVLVFAMIVFSSFVSSITAAMTQLRQLSTGTDKDFIMLRRYLRVRGVPLDLSVRIVRCVEHRLGARKEEIPETDVLFLQHLSHPLQLELLSHVYAPVLTRHPFFKHYAEADPVAMQQVCVTAVQRVSLSTGDTLFTEACTGDQLFFVLSGKLRYSRKCTQHDAEVTDVPPVSPRPLVTAQKPKTLSRMLTCASDFSAVKRRPSFQRSLAYGPVTDYLLGEGEWFCETSLWCPWAHMGTMQALVMTDILAVDAASLARVTSTRRLVVRGVQRYSRFFIEKLNREVQELSINDVCPLGLEIIEDLAARAFRLRRGSTKARLSLDNDPLEKPDQGVYESPTAGTVGSEDARSSSNSSVRWPSNPTIMGL